MVKILNEMTLLTFLIPNTLKIETQMSCSEKLITPNSLNLTQYDSMPRFSFLSL